MASTYRQFTAAPGFARTTPHHSRTVAAARLRNSRTAPTTVLTLLPLLFLLAACGGSGEGGGASQHDDTPPAAAGGAAGHGLSSAPYLAGLATVRVEGDYPRPFLVTARSGKIGRYPCASCHDRPLKNLKAGLPPKMRGTHREIARPHAPASTLACQDCHEDAGGMNHLRLADGSRVAFDHSYRVCAQCHFQQARAWAGGGHGKRLGGWAAPRVVKNCAGCHNPHDPLRPASVRRWPALVPNAPARRKGHGD